jgi:hypothetical protein
MHVSLRVITIGFFSVFAIVGMMLGGVSGWMGSRLAKGSPPAMLRDALLGMAGILGGFIGWIYLPWHRSAVSYPGNEVSATGTANYAHHPEIAALLLAVLLPFLYELIRSRFGRQNAEPAQDSRRPGAAQ